jgi:hypothetical protein
MNLANFSLFLPMNCASFYLFLPMNWDDNYQNQV